MTTYQPSPQNKYFLNNSFKKNYFEQLVLKNEFYALNIGGVVTQTFNWKIDIVYFIFRYYNVDITFLMESPILPRVVPASASYTIREDCIVIKYK